MLKLSHLLLAASLSVVLVACSSTTSKRSLTESLYVNVGDDQSFYPNLDWLVHRGMEKKMDVLAHEDFSIAIGTVIDRRKPQSFINDVETSNVIREFNPDHFLQGAPMFVQNLLQKNMTFGPPKPTVYVADVTLRHLRLRVLKGNLMSGRWGRYAVDMEFDVLVRDADGVVMEKTPVSIKHVRRRVGDQGRHPNTKQDRARMVLALEEAFKPLGVKLAWHARRGHLRRTGGAINTAQ